MRPSSLSVLRENRVFVVALLPAVALRVLAIAGYPPALWFWADSFTYVGAALDPAPEPYRPVGYSLLLAVLRPFHSLGLVAGVQHALGLTLAVALYVLLRRGLPGWAATVIVSPMLYDEFLILLEHMIMADTLFTVLVTVGVVLVIRPLTPARAAAAGAVLGFAAVTRSIGLAVVLLALGFACLRRVGVRPLATLTAAAIVPLIGYSTWMYADSGEFALTRADGMFLRARTMTFADCEVIRPRQPKLCPDQPVSARPAPAYWVWGSWSPLKRLPSAQRNAEAGRFAQEAILAQPGPYLAAAGGDLAKVLRWERVADVKPGGKPHPYIFPEAPRPLRDSVRATAETYEGGPAATRVVEPYAGWLRAYQRFGYLPLPLMVAALLAGQVVALVRRRYDALLPGLTATALIAAPAFIVGYDVRYVIPAIPLVCLTVGLAARRTATGGRPQHIDRTLIEGGGGEGSLHPGR
ncbi:hypothetical protein SAMN05421505_12665 [Sinosporangium album]|uniref:Dolichyl-phosphate-mannose-protein mannosyltransferase n=1 Tax=Sinosporangium album TaxID=504805 RepID=A0A1G8GC70_9ACTN|nr:hypothetical protein [Sinosporangium album]SDH91916.1 hypothetical protein SAMN05421505_12665 [Sinosporangium album]